ncbi:MAG: signal peptidase I [Candidatus Coproplasma sp.]
MSEKTKKILNIVVDVVVAIVLVFVLILAISTITSKAKGYDGYTAIFGKAYVAVASDSMKGDKEDNFEKGDLIAIKLLSEEEAQNLKVGDIITFRTNQISDDQTWVLNTHRIIEVNENATYYVTHGDNNPEGSNEKVYFSEIVGIYQGKAGGIGHVFLFMNSTWGFFACVVVPSLLVVVYFAINLVLVIIKERKVQTAAAEEQHAQQLAEEKERMRQELLAEMAQQSNGAAQPQPTETTKETNSDDK